MGYDPSNPRIYFDIGAAIAAIAILLAFVSLANPARRFRWSLGWFKLRTAYLFFFTAIGFILIGAWIPVLSFDTNSFIDYPIFWETLAAVLFCFGSLGLIIGGNQPVKFTRKNSKQFFNKCYSIIAQGDNKELGALSEEISWTAKDIINICEEYDSLEARFSKEEGRIFEVDDSVKWALRLLDLFSDKRFCNIIVTTCPITAIRYLTEIQTQRLYYSGGYAFIQQLIQQAFEDPSSILHREEKYYGLGKFLPFTRTVFGNYEFVESNFRPLQAAGFSHDNLRTLKKYIQCLLVSLEAYFKEGRFYEHPSAIWVGFDILAKSAWEFVRRLDGSENYLRMDDCPTWALTEITMGFKDCLKLIQKYDKDLPEYTFNSEGYNSHNDNSIYGIIAFAVYEFLKALAVDRNHDEDIRLIALNLWEDIYFPLDNKEQKMILEIQKRLETLIWRQVNRNLEEKYAAYPMITRLLINLIGLGKHPEATEGEKRVTDHIHKLLKEKFNKAAQLTEKRSKELLPDGFEYNEDRNELVQKFKWDQSSIVLICD